MELEMPSSTSLDPTACKQQRKVGKATWAQGNALIVC